MTEDKTERIGEIIPESSSISNGMTGMNQYTRDITLGKGGQEGTYIMRQHKMVGGAVFFD